MAPKLNYQCSLQNPEFNLQDLFFFLISYKKNQKQAKKSQHELYKNGHYFPKHMLHILYKEPKRGNFGNIVY
jgi:hypothetical protein